jgi:hypothetical protein
MKTEKSKVGFVSEESAQELLGLTKKFRQQWASFAVMSGKYFDAFRDSGASFPRCFLDEYQTLVDRKNQLAADIRGRTSCIPSEVWGPPSSEQTLQEFEDILSDLAGVCREVQKQIREKLERYLSVLNSVSALQSLDKTFSREFENVRLQSIQAAMLLGQEPHRVADAEQESDIAGYASLLQLTNDALTRQSGISEGGETARLCVNDFESHFETVCQKFGRKVALEAIRSRLVPLPIPATELVTGNPGLSDYSNGNSAPSKDAVASLIQNFNSRPGIVRTPSKRVASTATVVVAGSISPVSREQLAGAAHQLHLKADRLWPEGSYPYHVSGTLTDDHIRAIGFRNLALAIELAGAIIAARGNNPRQYRNELHQLLRLFAEAQNAVRTEQENYGNSATPITEQFQAFQWLKHICGEEVEAFRVERYMRIDDRADPDNNIDVARRIRDFSEYWSRSRSKEKHFTELTRAIERIRSESEPVDSDKNIRDWEIVDSHITSLVRLGIHTNDAGIRDLMMPIADLLPECVFDDDGNVEESRIDPSKEFSEVLAHIQKYLTDHIQDEQRRPDDQESQEVKSVRELLAGKTVAVVAGICKPHAAARIEHALHLNELRWLTASKKDRVSDFESRLKDVALVVLITKLIGHKHNDIRDMCKERGIPWVQTKINGGYSVNQVAATIMEQASQQLKSDR